MQIARIIGFVSLLLLNACAISPKHPALLQTELPELVPVRDFVADTDYVGGYRISPDGKRLAWNAVEDLSSAILWKDRSAETHHALKFDKSAPRGFWSADSRYILYHLDNTGSEDHHVYAIDTQNPDLSPRDLTPFSGVKAYVLKVPTLDSPYIYVMHNRRDRSVFDLYRVEIASAAEVLVHQNSDNVISLLVDNDGVIRARVKQTENERLLQVPADPSDWQTLITASKHDDLYPFELSADGGGLYVISNVGRDKRTLLLIDLSTNEQRLVYEHDDVDFAFVKMSRLHRKPLYIRVVSGYPENIYFDELFRQQMQAFKDASPAAVDITSIDREERFATLARWDHAGTNFYLIDLQKGSKELLAKSATQKRPEVWTEIKPVIFTASDGMQLHAYLSLPKIKPSKPLPTVLLVHGGPWGRDWWGHHTGTQFFTNRGYAVLRVNYRGSKGYGRRYMYAGVGEFAGKMHQDLIDAIDWAIDKGISDPEKIAIVGGSYGGYATLVGITMTPDRFACGVDNVGVADLATLIENFPVYWKPWQHLWHQFVGDPSDPQQRKTMDERSPLSHAHQAQAPLLIFHGVNDPRVKLDQSDRMVEALRAAGKDVEYVVVENEGHGSSHWKNRLDYFRRIEDFLAECLGGRSSGFDYYQLGSWAF